MVVDALLCNECVLVVDGGAGFGDQGFDALGVDDGNGDDDEVVVTWKGVLKVAGADPFSDELFRVSLAAVLRVDLR